MIFLAPHLDQKFSLQLDSLRGISAIIVLFTHCFQTFIAPFDLTLYSWIRLSGQAAVMMFFVLSGFLIGHSVQRNLHDHHHFNLQTYIQQRIKRILPPFAFAITLTVFLYFISPYFFISGNHSFEFYRGLMIREGYFIDLSSTLGSLFFINGFLTSTLSANAPLWSLSYEVWFYVLAALLPFLGKNYFSNILFILLLVVLSCLNLQFLIYFLVWGLAFALSFDVLSKQLTHSLRPLQYFFILAASCIAIWDHYQFHSIYETNIYTTENFTIFNVCIGIALSCWLIQLKDGQQKLSIIAPSTAYFSYTLYVTHFPLLLFIFGGFSDFAMRNIFSAWFTLTLTMLSLIIFAIIFSTYLEPRRRTIG